jgi:hypothetical protein
MNVTYFVDNKDNISKSELLKHEVDRTPDFLPNQKLIILIKQLKKILEPVQLELNQNFDTPKYPIVLIVGCPRTGSTLLSQILAKSNNFAYPTNFLSRFAYAPYIGAMIQQMIFNPEYDFQSELANIQSSENFTSNIGKTKGALAINEFFHFWRRFLPNYDSKYLTDDELRKVDIVNMRKELAAIESVFEKPFMSKGQMMQYNINYFAIKIPETVFIHIKRDKKYVMQSLLLSRRIFYGTDKIWRSVKPKEYFWLNKMDPIHQVAGQVLFTEKAINDQLLNVATDRKVVCHYEELCRDPMIFFNELKQILQKKGYRFTDCKLPKSFPLENKLKVSKSEFCQLEKAYESLSTEFKSN